MNGDSLLMPLLSFGAPTGSDLSDHMSGYR